MDELDEKINKFSYDLIDRMSNRYYNQYFQNSKRIEEALSKPLSNIWVSIVKTNVRVTATYIAVNKYTENAHIQNRLNKKEMTKILVYANKINSLAELLDECHNILQELFH